MKVKFTTLNNGKALWSVGCQCYKWVSIDRFNEKKKQDVERALELIFDSKVKTNFVNYPKDMGHMFIDFTSETDEALFILLNSGDGIDLNF